MGQSLLGRARSKPSHVRYAAESGSSFRALPNTRLNRTLRPKRKTSSGSLSTMIGRSRPLRVSSWLTESLNHPGFVVRDRASSRSRILFIGWPEQFQKPDFEPVDLFLRLHRVGHDKSWHFGDPLMVKIVLKAIDPPHNARDFKFARTPA